MQRVAGCLNLISCSIETQQLIALAIQKPNPTTWIQSQQRVASCLNLISCSLSSLATRQLIIPAIHNLTQLPADLDRHLFLTVAFWRRNYRARNVKVQRVRPLCAVTLCQVAFTFYRVRVMRMCKTERSPFGTTHSTRSEMCLYLRLRHV